MVVNHSIFVQKAGFYSPANWESFTKIVKELHHNRENMQLFIYPVYINDTSINVDEMVNCNIDGVYLPFSVKDGEMACTIYKQVSMLLYSFVLYLRDMSMRRKSISTDAEKDFEQEWIEDNASEFWLYTALKIFCDSLKSFQKTESESLLSIYRKHIMNIGKTEDSKQQAQAVKSVAEQGQRYLLYLHELIVNSLKKKEDWIIEGNESRGEKERCYYLDSNIWHDRFSEKLEKEKMETIGKHQIAAYLKENHLLKRQKSSSANTMYRYGKYCHVILADVFDNIVNQWNTPPE